MKHVDVKHFWEVVDAVDAMPLGARTEIDIDMQDESTFTTVSVHGRLLGEEVSCHLTGRSRCYLAEEV